MECSFEQILLYVRLRWDFFYEVTVSVEAKVGVDELRAASIQDERRLSTSTSGRLVVGEFWNDSAYQFDNPTNSNSLSARYTFHRPVSMVLTGHVNGQL